MSGLSRFVPATPDSVHSVELSFGVVRFRRSGVGPPLVLMHSNGHSHHEFDLVFDDFARSFDVIAWDMPGHGDSDPTHFRTSIDGFADAMVELLDGLGIDRAFVAGTSIGGFIACALGARHARRTTGTGIVETQLAGPDWWNAVWPMPEGLFTVPQQTKSDLEARLETEVTDQMVEQWSSDRHKAGTKAMNGVLWAARSFDVRAALAALQTPTLVLYGDKSPVINSKAVAETAGLPHGSRIAVLEGSGHFVSIDRPDGFFREISEFASAAAAGAARSTRP